MLTRAVARQAVLIVLLLVVPAAQAQLAPLPGVSPPRLPAGFDSVLPPVAVAETASQVDLAAARRLRVRALIRTHRELVEADPRGDPIVRGEILATLPSPASLATALAAGFRVTRTLELDDLDLQIVTLAPPARMSTRRALKLLRQSDPRGSYDYNHIYTPAGELEARASPAGQTVTVAAQGGPVIAGPAAPKIGLLDGGVSPSHPAFDQHRIHRWGCDGTVASNAHGTAVASLLVGQAAGFSGVLPPAELYAADVYCGLPTGGNVMVLAAALSWLAAQHVPVINVSLVGPADATLERVIARLVASGVLIVAAVGNDGPAAPPLYPAAYAGVIGVTGVDARRRVLLEAVRGPQVAFAAPGADMAAAGDDGDYIAVRGTSFAAPVVAALLADVLWKSAADAAAARVALVSAAVDLGSAGPDPIFGAGLVGERFRIAPPPLAAARIRSP